MTSKFKPFSVFLIFLFLVSLISAKAALLGVTARFYVWEFPIDVKILVFAALLLLYIRRYRLDFDPAGYGIFKWEVGSNILGFLGPLVILTPIIITGILFNKTTFEGIDELVTLSLATLLDIPSIYLFSLTVILAEELIFRGFIFDFLSRDHGVFRSIIISSIIWLIANLDKLAAVWSSSLFAIGSELLNLLSIGLASSAIYWRTKSIWPGYSFRVGLLLFSSALLASDANETSGIFYTESQIFSNAGLLFSAAMIIFSACLALPPKRIEKAPNPTHFPLF